MVMTTVADLIKELETYPKDMPICHGMYSENLMLDLNQITVKKLGHPRDDGWVPNARPDQPMRSWLWFPGN